MGLALKSVTGSRKVVENLNRFGHCISYHTAEALETELANNISDRNYATHDGITNLVGLCISLAWDNYDELTETLSGGGTLHARGAQKVPCMENTTCTVLTLSAMLRSNTYNHQESNLIQQAACHHVTKKINRANYVASLWNNAVRPDPTSLCG
jgi:hypothetical protein